MILYIITDSYNNYQNSLWFRHRQTFEEITGDTCIIMHYSQVNSRILNRIKPDALCHSGGNTPYEEYDVLINPEYRKIVTECNTPQLGICRGHQVVASFFGSEIGPMRRLEPDEPDIMPSYRPGFFKENGIYTVKIEKSDPLFDDCREIIKVRQSHGFEVKELAHDLDLLASSKDCQVQAFKHKTMPIYGVQFHPELFSDDYPDGKKVLENFFNIARK